MSMDALHVKRLDRHALVPKKPKVGDAGYDLHALETVEVRPYANAVVRTGIAVALPDNAVGLVCDRSSVAARGLHVVAGVIDAGYRGELKVVVANLTNSPIAISADDRFAQLLVLPILLPDVVETAELSATVRGASGFGSTGQ